VNETMRMRNVALTIERRAKVLCSSCGRPFLPSDLRAAPSGGYGSRVCRAEACWEKAKRWVRIRD
jgi:hypothetical protein